MSTIYKGSSYAISIEAVENGYIVNYADKSNYCRIKKVFQKWDDMTDFIDHYFGDTENDR